MSRSSSARSSGSAAATDVHVGEFGALFDSGSGKKSPRKRGLSVGNPLFSSASSASSSPIGRTRAGSSSSLQNSWIPPPYLPPPPPPLSSSTLSVPPPPPPATSSSSRGSADLNHPRRFSFSSNASQQSSQSDALLFPPPPSLGGSGGERGLTPPASPVVKARERAASVKVQEGETVEGYVERLGREGRKSEVARLLASHSDAFHTSALAFYFSTFDFTSSPLDIALRLFLMSSALPTETQQIDRVMEAFAVRYASSNPGLFASSDTPYVLAFSLVMLSTDQFNPSNKNKMSKADYVRNTKVDGVELEVLEYFFDQITITPFVFVEEEGGEGGGGGGMPMTRPELGTSTSSSFFSKASTAQKERAKLDPYHLIAQGQTHELRVDVESAIPEKSPFSFTGTTSFFNATTLHHAFARAPILQVSTRPRAKSSASTSNPTSAETGAPLGPVSSISTYAPPPKHESASAATAAGGGGGERVAVSSLKITKIGLLSRKEDLVEGGKKSSSRKWKGWSVILTGSQLLFFKDPGVALSLQQSIDAAAMAVEPAPDENSVLVFSTSMGFKPDAVLSLASTAAIFDSTYSKYQHVFRLVAPFGRQYLFQARDADDLNSWLAHINYAASFKTAGIRMRALAAPSSSSLAPKRAPATTVVVPEPVDPDLTIHALSPVSEEDATLPASLREALRTSGSGRPSFEHPFPRAPSSEFDPESSTPPSSAPSTTVERGPDTRAEVLRTKIAELEVEIKNVKTELHADLRRVRNLAVLTPFMRSTRERIQAALVPIEKRVRHARMNLAKLVCHREVLTRDLLVEDRESQRTRKVSRGRLSASHTHPFMLSASHGYPSSSTTTTWPVGQRIGSGSAGSRSRHSFAATEDPRDSFESASVADPYVGALTDDELDRMRSPPLMARSSTETGEQRRASIGAGGASEDELPNRDDLMAVRRPSPSDSTTSLAPGSNSVKSFATPSDLAPSEVGSLDSPVEGPSSSVPSLSRDEEEAEDWRRTRGANRVSLVDYSKLSELATLREDRRGEGSAGSILVDADTSF